MHKLLYYPNFEIQDKNFLKFALLYVDEIRPIIPECARETLSESMQSILRNTDLINPYTPNYVSGYLASVAAIRHLEERKLVEKYRIFQQRSREPIYNYTLYADKYTYEFENYCLENGLGKRCNEGIMLNDDVAYAYMSILAEIVSKETETDMITDIVEYADPALKNVNRIHCHRNKIDRLGIVQREIQFYVPYDMQRIPLNEFISLRADNQFERARRNFVMEFNSVLDCYDRNVHEVDLNNILECKREIYGLMKETFISCAAVAVGVHSFGNVLAAGMGTLDFWGNAGNIGISLDTIKQHCFEAKEYAKRIENKRQARKYLAKLKQLRAELL